MIDTVTLENVEIVHRNFLGEKAHYIEILLSQANAKTLIANGWDVYSHSSILRIHISFDIFRPCIFLITKQGKSRIGSREELAILSDIKFKTVDVIIGPYKFKEGTTTDIKASVRSMYATIEE